MQARIQRGRDTLVIDGLDDHATCADLKRRLASEHGIPIESARLTAKGKTLDDEAAVPSCKLLLLQKPQHAQARSKTISLTLRCLASGRVAHKVDVPADATTEQLTTLAVKALGLSPPRAIFLEQGQQLMRADLSVADYSSIHDGTEIFVIPAPGHPPATADEAALPLQLPPSILEAPPAMPAATAPTKATDAPKATVPVPSQLRSGLLPPVAAPSRSVAAMSNLPLEVVNEMMEGLQRELRQPEGEVLYEQLREASRLAAGDSSLPPEVAAATMELIEDMAKGGGMGMGAPLALAAPARAAERQAMAMAPEQKEHLEGVCSKLVRELQRNPPPPPLPSEVEAKREQAAWGKGLSKGFLTRPRRRPPRRSPSRSASPPMAPRRRPSGLRPGCAARRAPRGCR